MKKKIILIVIIIAAISMVVYFVFNGQMPNTDGIFTKYDTLKNDSIEVKKDTSSSVYSNGTEETNDTLFRSNDSLDIEMKNVKTNNTIQLDTTTSTESKEKESIFQVNTSYEKIPNARIAADKLNMVNQHKVDNDLFSELLQLDEEEKVTLSNAFSENTIPYNSILKLLSVAGQDILLKEDNHISQMIIDAIGDSDHIALICIVDRKGNISYSSHKTLANSSILSSLTNISLATTELEITEVNGHNWVSIPIFHTYGKIGYVLININ